VQVDAMPAELQSARIKAADFAHLAKLRWSSQQLVAAMRLFHQATGHFRRDNLQVLRANRPTLTQTLTLPVRRTAHTSRESGQKFNVLCTKTAHMGVA